MNRVGAIAVVTAYMKLGDFQTVIWDWRAQQDPDVGWIMAELKTLEAAEGFHFALTQSLYKGEFGSALREAAARHPDVGSIIPQ